MVTLLPSFYLGLEEFGTVNLSHNETIIFNLACVCECPNCTFCCVIKVPERRQTFAKGFEKVTFFHGMARGLYRG